MARVGLKKGKYNKHDTAIGKYAALTNSSVPLFEKLIDEKFAPEFNSAELYADDALAETDYSYKKGTLSLTVANDDDRKGAELLGNTIDESGEVTMHSDDVAPEIGYGHILPKQVNNKKVYKVEFFPRVKITKITTDAKTRGEGVEFGTTSIEGKVMKLASEFNGMKAGTWEKHQTFDTESDAEAYLDACLTPSVS